MGLLQLPVELLYEIIAWITAWSNGTRNALQTLYHLGLTHPFIWKLVERPLYAFNTKYCGASALIWAAIHGQEATARKSLAADASPNTEDCLLRTALVHAARHGHLDVVDLLLDHNADITLNNDFMLDPFFSAVSMGHKAMVELMLEKRPLIDLDKGYHMGCTYLFEAALHGHTEIVEFLLSKGADPKVQALEGAAAEQGHADTLKLILDHDSSGLESVDLVDHTPLALAARNGHLDAVEVLLAYGANTNARNPNGRTPLILATQARHVEIAKRLVQAGADISVADNAALFHALQSGLEELATLYIGLGGELRPEQQSWLIVAVSKSGYMNSLRQLLDMWPIKATGYRSIVFQDALHAAVKYKQDDLIDRLLEGGCPVDPLPSVNYCPQPTRIEYYGSPTPLWLAVQQGNATLVHRLLDRGANPNVFYIKKRGIGLPLNLAIIKGNDMITKALIDHGAEVEEIDNDRISPLHRIIQKGRHDLMEYMLQSLLTQKEAICGSKKLPKGNDLQAMWKTVIGKNVLTMLRLLLDSGLFNANYKIIPLYSPKRPIKWVDPTTYALSKGRDEIADFLHSYTKANKTSTA